MLTSPQATDCIAHMSPDPERWERAKVESAD